MHINFSPDEPASSQIDFETFLKVDIRIGEIIEVQDFPEARNPSFKLMIDFGNTIGIKKSSAQITKHYSKDDLIHKRVMCVVNFPPRQIGKFLSEVLVLGFSDSQQEVVLPSLDAEIPLGARLH